AAAMNLQRVAARKDISNRLDIESIVKELRIGLVDITATTQSQSVLPILVENAPLMRRDQPLSVQAENAYSRVLYLPHVFVGDITELVYRYNAVLRDVAEKEHVPYIAAIDEMPDNPTFYSDSSHTSTRGSKAFGEIVGSAMAKDSSIKSILEKRSPGCTQQ